MQEVKVWYKNSTVWTNIVGVAVIVATGVFGYEVPAGLAAGLVAVINAILAAPQIAPTEAAAKARNLNNARKLG